MRKIYILLGEEEEDGAVADALLARGLPAEEGELENPVCPLCQSGTLVAYREGDHYEVLTWYCLTEEDEGANADAWYLICPNFTCPYEEQVEWVDHPMEAVLFNLQQSHSEYDDYSGILSRRPIDLKELIRQLSELIAQYPFRKLQCFLDEARFRYDETMDRLRKWLNRVPAGRSIEFSLSESLIKATFLAASGDRFLARTKDGELLAVESEHLWSFGPSHFDEPDSPDEEGWESARVMMYDCSDWSEWVVVRGCHLVLELVDLLGQYHISCRDAGVANLLGLEQEGEQYWTGVFRRAEIEARYDQRLMVRVQGYWLKICGRSCEGDLVAVETEDRAVGEALGFRPGRPYFWEGEGPRPITHWTGVIRWEQVEAQDMVRTYKGESPELKSAEE